MTTENRHALVDRVFHQYGFNPAKYAEVTAVWAEMPTEALSALLDPTPEQVNAIWETCSCCGTVTHGMAPTDSPHYQRAIREAEDRRTS